MGGGGGPVTAPASLSASNNGVNKGKLQVGLSWTGGDVTVDVYRNGSRIQSAASNTGGFNDSLKVTGSGTLVYRVCNAGTTTCSADAAVNY